MLWCLPAQNLLNRSTPRRTHHHTRPNLSTRFVEKRRGGPPDESGLADMSCAASSRRAVRRLCSSSSASSSSEAWPRDGPFLRLQKQRGQHLLTNPHILDDIVRRAAIRPGDAVLEVGPGTGNLTTRLLASPAARVAAVEIDPRMAASVASRAQCLGLAHKLTVHHSPPVTTGDAMKVEFPEFDVCVSNIPYAISSPLTAKLLFGAHRFRTATLLVQREFARRLVGAPGHGERNHLATNARLVADVAVLMDVSKREFVPVPGVDSSLVEIRMKEARPTEVEPGIGLDEWLEFTRVCFRQHKLQQQQQRKNNKKKKTKPEKTLGTIFKQKEMAMELLRLSRRGVEEGLRGGNASGGGGHMALHGDNDVDGGGEEDEDDCCEETTDGFSKEEIVAFKERIAGALQSARLDKERPSRLSNDDLLRLLPAPIHQAAQYGGYPCILGLLARTRTRLSPGREICHSHFADAEQTTNQTARAICVLWARTAVRQASSSYSTSPEVGAAAAASEAWDGRFRLHKPRGQHLLTNPRVLDAIARRAGINPGDAVLEVGPGTGNLTARLLASPASRVAAVEIDPRMVEAVTARAAALGLADKLTVRPSARTPPARSNALEEENAGPDLEVEFPEFDVCVANIPYGISSPLIAKLLFGAYRFRTATLLVQKEFTRRLVATPGDGEYNRLAANVRLVADVRLLMDVSKRDFVPMPRVDSSLVQTRPRGVAPGVDLGEWLAFTRVCFGQKNKTLGAIFKQKRMVAELFSRSQRAEEHDGGAGGISLGALDDDCDEDGCGKGDDGSDKALGCSEEDVAAFKERIAGALDSTELASKRPSKLSNDELMRLLRLFNQRGVRFR
nr:unnamed protein product [Digitaria exilis]